MSLLAIPTSPPARRRPSSIGAAMAAHPVPVAVLALLVVLSPALFKHPAEPGDPVEYLRAAHCVAERFFCAPHDHWSARWPIFTPTGLLFRLIGESRVTLGLLPLLHCVASVALFAAILQRLFGRPTALIGGLLFASVPLVSELSMQLNADIVETSFLLGGVYALVCARERRQAWLLIAAGVLLALAVETRMTSVVGASLVGGTLLVVRWPLRDILLVGGSGATLLGASAAAHWIGTGDPLTLYRLSLAHTQVPTTELPAGLDTSGGPFFNLVLIQNWSRDVAVHWTVDPLVNLLVSAKVGGALSIAFVLFLLGRASFRGSSVEARSLRHLGLAAAAFLVIIAFGLSIHPTPRMFLPFVAAIIAMAALIVSTTRTDLRKLVLVLLVPLLMLQSFALRYLTYDPVEVERLAESWIATAGQGIATDRMTHRHLGMSKPVRALPEDERVPLQLVLASGTCETSPKRRPNWSVLRGARVKGAKADLIEALGRVGYRVEAEPWSLCLYRASPART